MNILTTRIFWIVLLVLGLCGGTVWAVLGLRPPPSLTLAAGPVEGAYHRLAERYRNVLSRDGITVDIIDSKGSIDNLALLQSGEADAAIVQGGLDMTDLDIEAIGKIFAEAVLFLRRDGLDVSGNPALWQDLLINRGEDGSGTAAAFDSFRRAVDLPREANRYAELGYSEAVRALGEGEIDLAVFVAPFDAPYLIEAYDDPRIHFVALDYVKAISRRWDHASIVTVPTGAISLDPVVPSDPQPLLALQTLLMIRNDLHPALSNRLTRAAMELHSTRTILNDHGEFPAVTDSTIPMNGPAREFILKGPTPWHEKLPYWVAAQINRFLVLLLPLLFLLVPLLRALPAAYAYAMNFRVWQHYPTLRRIEHQLGNGADRAALDQMEQDLADLDDQLFNLRLPAAYRQSAYHARVHVDLLRRRIITERAHLDQTAAPG